MHIMCCLKPVPKPGTVKVDPETHTLKREGSELVLNPYDRYALEASVSLAEETQGKVVAVAMGPPNARNILEQAYVCGADEVILLSDRAFAGSDTLATSYVLSKAAQKLGPFDLIVCGKVSIDGETAQVAPELAAWLSWPSVIGVKELKPIEKNKIEITRITETGEEILEAYTPLVVGMDKEINDPRPPSLKRAFSLDELQVEILDASKLGTQSEFLGLEGSPTRVLDVFSPRYKGKREVISGSPEEVVNSLVSILKERGLI